MFSKWFIRLYIVGFLFLLFAPGIGMLFDIRTTANLYGVAEAGEPPAFSANRYISGEFQTDYDNWIAKAHAFHGDFIRLNNEVRFNAFGAGNGVTIVGKSGELFEEKYILEYRGLSSEWYQTQEKMDALISDLKEIQTWLVAQGKPMAVLITPSKASIFPEAIPTRYNYREQLYEEPDRAYHKLIAALDQYDIPYVDGAALLKGEHPYPVFATTSVHWTPYAALTALQELQRTVFEDAWPTLSANNYTVLTTPTDTEELDGYQLLNLFSPHTRLEKSFYVPELSVSFPVGCNKTVFFQGGSFMWKMINLLTESNAFDKIFSVYYDQTLREHISGEQIDFASFSDSETVSCLFEAVTQSDSVVFEVNEQYASNFSSGFISHLAEYIRSQENAENGI